MEFKDYGFKPADVVKGLNEYYEKRKEGVYGTFIVRTGMDRLGETSYMNPDVYVKEAIDWLREEHGIFYTPGLEVFETDIFDNQTSKQINSEPVLRRNMVIAETYNALFGERMTKPVGVWNEGELTSMMVDEILAWKKAFREVHSKVTGDIVNTLTANPSALKEGILHKFDSCTGDRDFFMNKMNLAVEGKKATEDVLAELRAKVREVYREMYLTGGDEPDSYIECLDLILEEYRRVVQDKRSMEDWRKFESDRNEFIAKLFKALELGHDGISCLYADEEAAILKAIEENNKATASVYGWNQAYSKVRDILGVHPDSDAEAMIVAAKALTKKLADENRRRSEWHNRYLSEHKRANGEHDRAEKCFGEIAALKTQVAHLQKQVYSQVSVDSAIDALKHEIRTLREEKLHVISAIGQDIWDDCLK